MKKIITLIVWILCMQTYAQDLMRITTNDGMFWNFSINNVEEMKFTISKQLDVVGEWIWVYDGTLERYVFKSDGSFISLEYHTVIYDNHFIKLTEHKGSYSINNNIITINRSDGQKVLIEVLGFTDFQMVSGAGEMFYKVREPAYHITTADAPITIGNEGDIIQYADNYYTAVVDNKIKPITDGTGYALVEDVESKELKAYRVDIDYVAPPYVDWTQYYNASSEYIKEKFGDYDFQNEANTWVFMQYDAAIQSVEFTFTNDSQTVKEIEVNFYDKNKGQLYCESIVNNYTLFNSSGGVQQYLNPNNSNEIVYINQTDGLLRIIYNCARGN